MSDDAVRVLVVKNNFEKLQAELVDETVEIVAGIADEIEIDMIQGTSSTETAASIRQQKSNSGLTRHVLAGDLKSAFHAGFEEYGTIDQAAHPFATPAAENHRGEFKREMARIERRMKVR